MSVATKCLYGLGLGVIALFGFRLYLAPKKWATTQKHGDEPTDMEVRLSRGIGGYMLGMFFSGIPAMAFGDTKVLQAHGVCVATCQTIMLYTNVTSYLSNGRKENRFNATLNAIFIGVHLLGAYLA